MRTGLRRSRRDGRRRRLPFRAVDLSARTSFTPAAIKLNDLVARIDGAHVSGAFDYRLASGSAPARFDADLATPSLDLGEAADFDPRGLLTRTFGSGDGSLQLEAGALTLGQPDDPADSIGGLDIDLAKTGDKIELNELTFEGRDGAVITASGLLSQQKAHIDAKIMAPRASGLAALLDKLAPGQAADLVHGRAGLLTPIDLTLSADAAEHDSAFGVTALVAKGAIGGTSIEATVKEDPKQAGIMSISALAQAKDSLPVLRLLGLAPTSATAPGAAQIEIKAQGPLGGAAQTAIKAALGPASLDFQGEVVTDLTQPSARGGFRLSTPDAAPMLRTIGVVFPDFTAKLPATAAGDVLWSKAVLGFANLKAEIAGTSFAGALDYGKQAPGRLTGSIAVDQLPVLSLFGLLLGPPEPAKAGSLWSSLTFAPAALDLPDASIALTIGDSALPAPAFPRGASAKDARAVLLTGPGLLDLQDLSCDIGGARSGATSSCAARRAMCQSKAISTLPTWRLTVPRSGAA